MGSDDMMKRADSTHVVGHAPAHEQLRNQLRRRDAEPDMYRPRHPYREPPLSDADREDLARFAAEQRRWLAGDEEDEIAGDLFGPRDEGVGDDA